MSDAAKAYCRKFTATIAACDVCSKKPVIAMFEGSDFGEPLCDACWKKLNDWMKSLDGPPFVVPLPEEE